jgi:hypothetical protein
MMFCMSTKAMICGIALLGLASTGCNRIGETFDPVAQGINPRVVDAVHTAKQTQTGSAQDAALLSFYYNNRTQLKRKDVEYIAHATQTGSAQDTILIDWASTERLGIEYNPPGGLK